ncbi:hypothetical protein C8N35_101303 [Breoghania corrubedonensis]|uniref:Protoheme IX farnesyltransferase n=1 Tax=Breoghania corrubedonensis TaxID=665038 RepID=A0A2T5VET6_9HYPH|nr:hypothetical protein [Breoghania corrubedonensis]PTW62263.1 hypothetical protein C8N35_101303 [Breoghania corrubedonensis]
MSDDRIVLSPEQKKRRRTRSIAIAVVLAALVVLFYAVTIAKMSVNLEGVGG